MRSESASTIVAFYRQVYMPVSRNCILTASGRNVLGIDGLEALVNGLRERDEACELPSNVENWPKQWSFPQSSEKEKHRRQRWIKI
jgi:hypothetical protein